MTYRGFDQPYFNKDFGPDDVVCDGDWLARELDVLDALRGIVKEWQEKERFSARHFNAHVAMAKVQEAMEQSVHEPHDVEASPDSEGSK